MTVRAGKSEGKSLHRHDDEFSNFSIVYIKTIPNMVNN